MDRLPIELVQRILVQVSVPDLLIVALSSKRMRAIARATHRHLARHAAHVTHQLRIAASIDNTDFFYLGQMHRLEREDDRAQSGSVASERRDTLQLANDARFVDFAVNDTRGKAHGAIPEADPNVQRQYENSIDSFFIILASLVPYDVTRTRLLCHVARFSLAGVSHVVTRSTVVDTPHSVACCHAWSETSTHYDSDPYANPINISRTHTSTCQVCSFILSSIQNTSNVELFQYQPIDKNYRVFHRTWNDSIHLELRSGAGVILDIEHRDELDFDPNNIWAHHEADYLDDEQRNKFRLKHNSSVDVVTRRYGLIEDAYKARNLEKFFGVDSGLYHAREDEVPNFCRAIQTGEHMTTDPPISPANNDMFWVFYGICLPLNVLGLVVNAVFATAFRRYGSGLLSAKIDRVASLLIYICLYWASVCITKYMTKLVEHPVVLYQIEALLGSVTMVSVFSVNWMLALERFHALKGSSAEQSKKFYGYIYSVAATLVAINVVVFGTSPSNDALRPAYPTQAYVWFISMFLGFLVIVASVTYLYATTYKHCSVRLRSASTLAQEAELLKIERRVMFNCIIMGCTLSFAYLPGALETGVRIFGGTGSVVVEGLGYILVSMDLVVTPLLLAYFMPQVRSAVLGVLYGEKRLRNEFGWTLRPSSDMSMESGQETDRRPRKFHVLRVIE
ncbi:hypothetical protein HDU81_002874 [Chytriomyces hyalinus]|nr:hypothetical protein HDU81_002874 [Chytriomyces hyalinus]